MINSATEETPEAQYARLTRLRDNGRSPENLRKVIPDRWVLLREATDEEKRTTPEAIFAGNDIGAMIFALHGERALDKLRGEQAQGQDESEAAARILGITAEQIKEIPDLKHSIGIYAAIRRVCGLPPRQSRSFTYASAMA